MKPRLQSLQYLNTDALFKQEDQPGKEFYLQRSVFQNSRKFSELNKTKSANGQTDRRTDGRTN
jgi:hypothetical protein